MRRRPFSLIRADRQLHVQYYGYGVYPDWLIQFVEQHWSEALPNRNAKNYDNMPMTRAYEPIRCWSAIYALTIKDCFVPKGSGPPDCIALLDGDDDGLDANDELASVQIDTIMHRNGGRVVGMQIERE